jgi:hypothetical protein
LIDFLLAYAEKGLVVLWNEHFSLRVDNNYRRGCWEMILGGMLLLGGWLLLGDLLLLGGVLLGDLLLVEVCLLLLLLRALLLLML